MKVFLVSGAYSSKNSWNYFKTQLPENVEIIHTEYNSEEPLEHSIKHLTKFINDHNPKKEDIALIGYSLGGVVSFALAQNIPEVKKLVAIASPFGGIMMSRWMSHITFTMSAFNTFAGNIPFMTTQPQETVKAYRNFWNNVHPDNSVLYDLKSKPLPCESQIFVMESSRMHIWVEPSDGTVTVRSQMALGNKQNLKYFKIDGNHLDGLLNPNIAESVSNFISTNSAKPHRSYAKNREPVQELLF